MNKYEEIYRKYGSDEIDEVQALEALVEHLDPEAARFWLLLKGLEYWGGTEDLRQIFLAELDEFFKK